MNTLLNVMITKFRLVALLCLAGLLCIRAVPRVVDDPPGMSPEDDTCYGCAVETEDGYDYSFAAVGYDYNNNSHNVSCGGAEEYGAQAPAHNDCSTCNSVAAQWYDADDPAFQDPVWDSFNNWFTWTWNLYETQITTGSCPGLPGTGCGGQNVNVNTSTPDGDSGSCKYQPLG